MDAGSSRTIEGLNKIKSDLHNRNLKQWQKEARSEGMKKCSRQLAIETKNLRAITSQIRKWMADGKETLNIMNDSIKRFTDFYITLLPRKFETENMAKEYLQNDINEWKGKYDSLIRNYINEYGAHVKMYEDTNSEFKKLREAEVVTKRLDVEIKLIKSKIDRKLDSARKLAEIRQQIRNRTIVRLITAIVKYKEYMENAASYDELYKRKIETDKRLRQLKDSIKKRDEIASCSSSYIEDTSFNDNKILSIRDQLNESIVAYDETLKRKETVIETYQYTKEQNYIKKSVTKHIETTEFSQQSVSNAEPVQNIRITTSKEERICVQNPQQQRSNIQLSMDNSSVNKPQSNPKIADMKEITNKRLVDLKNQLDASIVGHTKENQNFKFPDNSKIKILEMKVLPPNVQLKTKDEPRTGNANQKMVLKRKQETKPNEGDKDFDRKKVKSTFLKSKDVNSIKISEYFKSTPASQANTLIADKSKQNFHPQAQDKGFERKLKKNVTFAEPVAVDPNSDNNDELNTSYPTCISEPDISDNRGAATSEREKPEDNNQPAFSFSKFGNRQDPFDLF